MKYKVNDIIEFGNYWQDESIDAGKKPIEWVILDIKDDRMLLLSKYVLDNMEFDNSVEETTWEKSVLRKWLNNEETLENSFINNAFNETEQNRIITTDNISERNIPFCTDFNEHTRDKIFILTIDDLVKRYFHNDNERIVYPTKYVKANNAVCNISNSFSKTNVGVMWWVRNRGRNKKNVVFVCADGRLSFCGFRCDAYSIFVRPALWLKY